MGGKKETTEHSQVQIGHLSWNTMMLICMVSCGADSKNDSNKWSRLMSFSCSYRRWKSVGSPDDRALKPVFSASTYLLKNAKLCVVLGRFTTYIIQGHQFYKYCIHLNLDKNLFLINYMRNGGLPCTRLNTYCTGIGFNEHCNWGHHMCRVF
jgi:hypothetical protein